MEIMPPLSVADASSSDAMMADRVLPNSQPTFQAMLDAAVYSMLRPTLLLLATVLMLWTYSHLQRPQAQSVPLSIVSVGLGGLFLFVGLNFKRLKIPVHHANSLAAGIVGLLLFHRLLSLMLTLEVEQTTSLALILVGTGFIVLNTRLFMTIAGVTFCVWAGIALGFGQLSLWLDFGMQLFSALALALVMHNARLQAFRRQESLQVLNALRTRELEYRAVQMETLYTAGHNINAILNLDTLLTYVVDLIHERFDYYYVGIFQLDETEDYVISRAGTGPVGHQLTEQKFKLKVGDEGLIGWVAAHRQPLCVNDVLQDARYLGTDSLPGTRSELVLPLVAGESFVGILDVQSNHAHAFPNADVRVFQFLAEQIAIAIQNAASYAEEHSRRVLTQTLFEIGKALSRTLDLQEVLNLILEKLAQIVTFNRGAIMLQMEHELEIVAAVGFPMTSNPLRIRVPLKDEDVFGQIHRTKKPLVVPDVLQRADWQHVENLPQARSWAGLPFINADGEVIGMLSLTRETPEPFTTDQVDFATAFAGHAAFALQNAKLYSELTAAYDELSQLDRAKSDFITIASHELRTPLTLLRGYSQILMKDPAIKASPIHAEMVNGIHSGAVRMHEIVESMVDMAKIDSRTLELFVEVIIVDNLLAKVLRPLRAPLQERNLTLTTAISRDLPTLKGDADALKKVFHHLIINAIKYTPDGGTIKVTVRPLTSGEHEMAEGGIEAIVSDNGIGIDPRYHKNIFAKFSQRNEVAFHSSGRTKFKGGGPGLGLAIVKGIVETHGGIIWVESEGHDEENFPGSRFHVILPLTPPCKNGECLGAIV